MTVSADRPQYLEQTLDSWRHVRSTEDWVFGFSVEPGPHLRACADLIDRFTESRKSFVIVNPKRYGVLRNPFASFNNAFRQFEFVVLSEEDVEVSNDILEFFSCMSSKYIDAQKVLAVCAENWCAPGNDHDAVFLDPRFCPLVWGTWQDRWENTLRDTWDLDYSTGNADGSHAGWDWNINRIIKSEGFKVAAPGVARSLHIGRKGVHMLEQDFAASQSPTYVASHTEFHWGSTKT
jgi:hypothetical protein